MSTAVCEGAGIDALETPAKSSAVTRRQGRLEFLDVVRGLAALAVFAEHCIERYAHHVPQWFLTYVNLGQAGVAAFFIVSGFIIPVSLERYSSLRKFWLGRLLRLWPMYVLSIALALLLGQAGARLLPKMYHENPVRLILGSLTMCQEFLKIPFVIGVYWTLSLELIFYVLCSILFVAGVLRRTSLLLWSSLLILLVGQIAFVGLHHGSTRGLPGLPAGRIALIVTAFFGTYLFRKVNEKLSWKVLGLVPALFAVFAIVLFLRYGAHATVERTGAPCLVLSYAVGYTLALVCYALRARRFPGILSWLGRISYSLYLLHDLVLFAVPTDLPPLVFAVLTLGLTLGLSHCTYCLIEKPMGIFQHRVLNGMTGRGRLAAVRDSSSAIA